MKKLLIASAVIGVLATPSFVGAQSDKSPLPASTGQGFTQEGLKRIDAFFADRFDHGLFVGHEIYGCFAAFAAVLSALSRTLRSRQ